MSGAGGARGAAGPSEAARLSGPNILRPCVQTDVPRLAAMRRAREEWMQQLGIEQWKVGSLDAAQIRAEVARGEWHALDAGGSPEGHRTFDAAVRLIDDDPSFWEQHERAAEPALYVHGLMTDPSATGLGLGARLLDLAWAEAGRRGARWLRLDCAPHLLDYYRPKGFTPVGRMETEEFESILLEKPAPDGPSGRGPRRGAVHGTARHGTARHGTARHDADQVLAQKSAVSVEDPGH